MIHDKARVEAIRTRAQTQIELIKSLEAKIVKGKLDALEVERLQLGDIETQFLKDLDLTEKTLLEEARWLSCAELVLQTWEPYVKNTEAQFNKYGSAGMEIAGG